MKGNTTNREEIDTIMNIEIKMNIYQSKSKKKNHDKNRIQDKKQ